MRDFTPKFVLFFMMIFFLGCQENSNTEAKEVPQEEDMPYVGEWESLEAEDLGNGTFASRYFKLEEKVWEVRFTLYLDSMLTSPVFQFRGVGEYELQGKSEVVEGAENALFGFDHKYVTLLTDNEGLISNFGFDACELVTGVEKNITTTGCSFLVSKSVCGQEYDLLKLDQGLLYFGMRPSEGDMCAEERRPRALFYPLKRATAI